MSVDLDREKWTMMMVNVADLVPAIISEIYTSSLIEYIHVLRCFDLILTKVMIDVNL